MGDGTGSAPPGPDRTATPVSPPRTGVASCSGFAGQCGTQLRRCLGLGVTPGLAQQALQQDDGSRLGQRLVAVAAFGRLDAGGAAGGALAGGNCLGGGAQPVARGAEAALGEAGA